MFLFGPPDVEKMKARGNVRGLIRALKYKKDWHVRWEAAHALGKIGDVRAVEPLIAALKDEESWVRKAAAEALGKIGDNRAVEPLIVALKDEKGEVRGAATYALGKIGDAGAAGPLIEALDDDDDRVRLAAAENLKYIGSPAVAQLKAILSGSDSARFAAAEARAVRQKGGHSDEKESFLGKYIRLDAHSFPFSSLWSISISA